MEFLWMAWHASELWWFFTFAVLLLRNFASKLILTRFLWYSGFNEILTFVEVRLWRLELEFTFLCFWVQLTLLYPFILRCLVTKFIPTPFAFWPPSDSSTEKSWMSSCQQHINFNGVTDRFSKKTNKIYYTRNTKNIDYNL